MRSLSLRIVNGYWTCNPTVNGKRTTWTLGPAAELTESQARIELESRQTSRQTQSHSACRARKLGELYLEHAAARYVRDDGKPTGEAMNILYAVRPFNRLFGRMEADAIRPRHLKLFVEAQIKADVSRQTINKRLGILKRMLRWGKNEELSPAAYEACRDFESVRKSSGARDAKGIGAVPIAQVEQTLAVLPATVEAMVRLQMATAMRPEEVCALRIVDIDMTQSPWMYIPRWHKNKWRGRQRRIFFGPGAREILKPYIRPGNLESEIFSPRIAVSERRGKPPKSKRIHHSYTTRSYRKAIWHACDKVFPMPDWMKDSQRKAWRREHRWSPNRLRKLALDQVERVHGKQAAKAVAGHSRVETTQEFYLSQDEAAARRVAETA